MTFVDCHEALKVLGNNYTAGVFFLKMDSASGRGNPAFCDMNGWTVLQSRGPYGNPSSYFYRDWNDYAKGFGTPGYDRLMFNCHTHKYTFVLYVQGREHWLGLEYLHAITSVKVYTLRQGQFWEINQEP